MSRKVVGTIFAVSVVALVAAATGCGGGSDSSSLSKSEYAKQAGLICQDWLSEKEEAIQTAGQKIRGHKPTQKDQEELVLAVLRPYEETTEKLEDLGAPEGGDQKVQELVEARQEAVERVKANPGTALVSSAPFRKADELAVKTGLERCQA